MKKIIALVICVMMLASTVVIGVSAARDYSAEWVSNPVTNKVLDTSVSDGVYLYLGGIDFSTGNSAEFDMEFVRDAGTYSDGWGLNWPCLHKDKIGVGNEMIAYNFNLNTVYNIKFVVVSGGTEIFVNGISIGTVSKALASFGCGVEGIKFDNFVINGSQTTSQDFEGYDDGYDVIGNGRWYFSDGNGGASVVSEEAVVEHNKYLDTSVSDGTYIYCGDISFGAGSNVYFDLAFADTTKGTYSDAWGLSWLNLHGDKIGVGSSTIAYAFEANKFYKVRMAVGDGSTEIFIDGTSIGTVSAQLANFACGVEGVLFDNIVVVKTGKVYNQDFEGYDANYDVVGNGRWYFNDGNAGGSQVTEVSNALVDEKLVIDHNDNIYNVTHEEVKSKVLDTTIGDGCYIYCGDLNVSGQDVEFDLYLKDDNSGTYSDVWGLAWLNIHTDKIGVGGTTLPATIASDAWHRIVYSVGSGETTIYVDGTEIGTVAVQLDKFACGIEGAKFDNIVVGDKSQDFEGYDVDYDAIGAGRWYFASDGAGGSQIKYAVKEAAYTETVKKDLGEYYWLWDEDNQYAYMSEFGDKAAKWEFDLTVGENRDSRSYFGNDPIFHAQVSGKADDKYIACGANGHFADESPVNGVTDDFTMRVVLKSSAEYFENEKIGEMVGWLDGSPLINMYNDTISFVGAPSTISYDFQDDTLYTIDFVVDGDTTVYVNGTEVGTIAKNMRAIVYGVFYRYLVKEVAFIKDGSAFVDVNADTMSTGAECGWLADAPVVAEEITVVTPGAIGVGSTTLPYAFEKGEWYHVVLDGSAGNGTDIYVDGAYVGHVANTIKSQWCGKPGENIGIDNLKITADGVNYFEDFEDKSFGKYDGNGYAEAYEFVVVPPEPEKEVFDFIETGTPGGEAYLVKGGYDYQLGLMGADDYNAYYDMDTAINPGRSEYVINFDLALIPETDTKNSCFFEIWSDVAYKRWIVGTEFTGYNAGTSGTEDYTTFDWGEATKDNFHNVTYIFRKNFCTILVDGVAVYSGRSNNSVNWTNMMIGNVYNGSAILDNVQLFKFTDANPKQPNELEALEVRMAADEDVKVINLDASDFCAANGHIQKNTVRTTEPACEVAGVDTTYCAVCGGVAKTTEVPALGHSWPNYYNGVHKEEGVWSWECKRGCGTIKSTTVPTPAEGSYDLFLDFSDAVVVQRIAEIFNGDGETVAKGIGTFGFGCEQNYNQFDIRGALRNQYTISFDFRFNGTFDTNDTSSYGHTAFFWYGGDSGIANEAGYDFDRNVFFARPWNSNAYAPVEVAYELEVGVWHQLMFKVYAPGEESDENWVKFFIDGEEVLSFDEWYDTTYYVPTQQSFCIIRDFGVAADIDNFAIGTIDLELETKRVVGDITGDGMIGTKDVKLLKLALAERVTLTAVELKYADVDGDGSLTSKDLAALKKLIVG